MHAPAVDPALGAETDVTGCFLAIGDIERLSNCGLSRPAGILNRIRPGI
jgi:hypothetical protein